MIPVLGIPCISQPNLLRDCVASIDIEIERLVIIDNSPAGGITDAVRDAVPSCVKRLIDYRPLSNLGFSGSLNALIKGYPKLPWWGFANADIVFGAGDLDQLAGLMERHEAEPFLCGLIDHRAFGINYACIDKVGFWDENFVPVYCEDTDYTYRMRVAGATFLRTPAGTGHVGSATIQEHPFASYNQRTYPSNRIYYTQKWGGDIGNETFTTPFNLGGSLADWTLRLDRLRDNDWS